jgi:hypothetical protein
MISYDNDKIFVTADEDGDFKIAQMLKVSFWVAHDHKFNTYLIQGYEVEFEKLFDDSKPIYVHYVPKGRGRLN